jgi:4-amino-4-deoxy-L-arabinose transferase-like glycosyltransferase
MPLSGSLRMRYRAAVHGMKAPKGLFSPSRLRLIQSPWTVVCIVALAFALRVAMTSVFIGLASPPKEAAGGLDVVDYEGFAWRVAEGRGYVLEDGVATARRSPGTSFALVPVYLLFGHSYPAAHLWFCLLSALTCSATVWLAGMAVPREMALLAGLWLAVYPGHAHASMHFFSEVPLGLALVLACAATVRLVQGGPTWWASIAGVLWGVTVLIRPNMLAALAAAIVGIVVPAGHRRANLRRLAVLVAVAAITVAPWVVRNALVMGRPTIATVVGGYTFWGANNELVLRDKDLRGFWIFDPRLVDPRHPLVGDEVTRDAMAWRYGLQFVHEHLSDMPSLVAARLWRLISPFESTSNRAVYYSFAVAWLVTVPFVVRGSLTLSRINPLFAAVLLAPILGTVVTAAIFYGSIRFRDSVAPVLLIFAAAAVPEILHWPTHPAAWIHSTRQGPLRGD